MPRDLTTDAKSSIQSPINSVSESGHSDKNKTIKEEGFETVEASEAETPGSTSTEGKTPGTSHDDLSLKRFTNNLEDPEDVPEDDEDDSDDDEHVMASHPIFGMLAGRLGQRRRGSTHKYDKFHPENQVLTIANVNDCVQVEKAFPEHERCSKEKFEYRLSRCPELSLGLFTQPTKSEVDNGITEKRKLIAHIIATRTGAPCVTDASMEIPPNWQNKKSTIPDSDQKEAIGHQDVGGTICIHSLAVNPEYQSLGLGSVLLKSYIQRMKDSKIADRLALLAHEEMIKFYERFGFENMGHSSCTFGGGGWCNMTLEFSDIQEE